MTSPATLPAEPHRVEPAHDPYARTVHRRFVRRVAVAEVMITDWRRNTETSFTLHAQWPRAHSFYRAIGGVHDPLLIAETARQATFLVCHAALGVPLDHQFLMKDLAYTIEPEPLRVGAAPTALTIELECLDVKHRRGLPASMGIRMEVYRDGVLAGSVDASLDCVNPKVYAKLRETADVLPAPLPPPVLPDLVGCDDPQDVVLSPTARPEAFVLRADQDHPILFDHPVDHLPGMVVLEAMRQAAQYMCGPERVLPIALAGRFFRFIELDGECVVHVRREPPDTAGDMQVAVTVEQHGIIAAAGAVTTRAV